MYGIYICWLRPTHLPTLIPPPNPVCTNENVTQNHFNYRFVVFAIAWCREQSAWTSSSLPFVGLTLMTTSIVCHQQHSYIFSRFWWLDIPIPKCLCNKNVRRLAVCVCVCVILILLTDNIRMIFGYSPAETMMNDMYYLYNIVYVRSLAVVMMCEHIAYEFRSGHGDCNAAQRRLYMSTTTYCFDVCTSCVHQQQRKSASAENSWGISHTYIRMVIINVSNQNHKLLSSRQDYIFMLTRTAHTLTVNARTRARSYMKKYSARLLP